MKANYTFKDACDSCDGRPVLKNLGMCAVCTFGEADSMWEWLDDDVTKIEHKAAKKYLVDFLQEVPDIVDDKGNVNMMMAMMLHMNEHVFDRIEEIL